MPPPVVQRGVAPDDAARYAPERTPPNVIQRWLKQAGRSIWGPTIAVVLSLSWLADGLHGVLGLGDWGWVVLGVAGFLIGRKWWQHAKRRSTRTSLPHEARERPVEAVVAAISTIGPFRIEHAGSTLRYHATDPRAVTKVVDLTGCTLPEAIDRLEPIRPPWQQLLRGIEPHASRNRLKTVVLIGSVGGSARDLPAAQQLIRYFLGEGFDVRAFEADFDSYEEIQTAYESAINELLRESRPGSRGGYREKQIVIDITGATKPVSIAGAVFTLDRQVMFQYVETDDVGRSQPAPAEAKRAPRRVLKFDSQLQPADPL